MNAIAKWFIINPIAAKIIMLVILLGGLMSYPILSKQYFPSSETDLIRITVPYPGAGPDEVETQICRRIEEVIEQLGDIQEIRSTAREGLGEVVIEVKSGGNTQRLLNEVKANVDAINTFPAESERPQIVEAPWQFSMMRLQLAGHIDERSLKELGEEIREELAALPSVALVKLRSPRRYEVGIEISESALREYKLSFDDIATAVRGYSVNLPAGKIRDAGGDIQVQTRAQANSTIDFNAIPIMRKSNGAIIRVGDVATVIDGFEDVDYYSTLNGMPSLQLDIINQSRPNILVTSKAVKTYIENKQTTLPNTVTLSVWTDASISYQGRLNTLLYNGSSGLMLVFIVLFVFLSPALAVWVCSGIAVAFLGALWGLSLTPVSLNVMSMFSFIMILGIIVDDAIIVGEAVYSRQTALGDKRLGAIQGVKQVMVPVFFAVISTIVFFIPFFFLSDNPNTAHIATPVILALLFSLFESLFLLPSHLGHKTGMLLTLVRRIFYRLSRPLHSVFSVLERRRLALSNGLLYFANTTYRKFLLRVVSAKFHTVLVFSFLFSFAIATANSGWLPFTFFPRVTSDYVTADATLPEAVPFAQSHRVMQTLELSGQKIKAEINRSFGYPLIKGVHATTYSNKAKVTMLLDDSSDRPVSAKEVVKRWRAAIGDIQGVSDLRVDYTLNNIDKPIEFILGSESEQQLKQFSEALVNRLRDVQGVYDVRSSLESPANAINLSLHPEAETLAISLQDVSRQVRRAFYGEEVQRIPRAREDVKVLVRYPRKERSYEEALKEMYIPNPASNGNIQIPLESLVDIEYSKTYKKIDRLNGQRTAKISANLDEGFVAADIIKSIQTELAKFEMARYPDVNIGLDGEALETKEFVQRFTLFFVISMLVIYGLMAVMFHSYWQPILVLTAVPFGYMGAVFGHVIIGIDISMLSMLGILACAGVVVNDNVVLIDRINQLRAQGFSSRRAVVNAAVQRFRPIVLTSVTTFLGLTPILLETSFQAQFLIPMVTSLSFGVLFATLVTLLFVPALYLIGERVMKRLGVSTVPELPIDLPTDTV